MESKKRIVEYDVSKGIGILLVVIGHGLSADSYWHTFIYSFHMPLFFFLSGLVMKDVLRNEKIKELFLEENRLIASYLFYSALYVAFDVIVRFLILKIINEMTIFKNIWQTVTLFGSSVLWFLSSLILGKVITKCIAAITKNYKKIIIIAIAMFVISGVIAKFVRYPESDVILVHLIYYPVVTVIRAFMMSSFILIGYAMRESISTVVTAKSAVFMSKKVNLRRPGG